MNVTPIIARLKSEVPAFSNRVFGSAAYAQAMNTQLEMALPHAFVIPTAIEAEPNELMGGLTLQRVSEAFRVVIVVDNTSDERGQTASEAVEAHLSGVITALVGWQNEAGYSDFELVGGEMESIDRARLGWGFDFTTFYDFYEQ